VSNYPKTRNAWYVIMSKKIWYEDGTYFDQELGEIVDPRRPISPARPSRPIEPFIPPRSSSGSFSRGLRNFFSGIGTFFVGLGMYLPQILSVLLFVGCLFTDSHGSVKLLMIIPCGIVFFTGWKGLIGLVILVGLVQAC